MAGGAKGNLRFDLYISETHLDFALFQLPQYYPTEKQYYQGVSLKTAQAKKLCFLKFTNKMDINFNELTG